MCRPQLGDPWKSRVITAQLSFKATSLEDGRNDTWRVLWCLYLLFYGTYTEEKSRCFVPRCCHGDAGRHKTTL
ncbi:hypothetical protein CEXT_329681 [Caerostris extrusa]|uniref:Uncharacterized protein n=1 Tax=Caerostris extrusa TaxID=172846 RepID=A0AAV4T8Z7_CAEEX|nr:hypothetical protein CEXT_329681 [Caerostris extrusa]